QKPIVNGFFDKNRIGSPEEIINASGGFFNQNHERQISLDQASLMSYNRVSGAPLFQDYPTC
ncbi:MAG: hypothetical protein MUF22_08525, partial [Chitinispirillaceae bacterium]|nr:hypothetical protein [Chitinispirillaceae bacterium]